MPAVWYFSDLHLVVHDYKYFPLIYGISLMKMHNGNILGPCSFSPVPALQTHSQLITLIDICCGKLHDLADFEYNNHMTGNIWNSDLFWVYQGHNFQWKKSIVLKTDFSKFMSILIFVGFPLGAVTFPVEF